MVLTRGSGQGLEVLLVERSPALRFLGGYWAFPGGVLDPELDGGAGAVGASEDPESLHACGVRELFEETGILLPPWGQRLAALERGSLRAALLAEGADAPGRTEWREATRAAQAQGHRLRRVCRITTPEFAARRYRTLFLQAQLPERECLRILPGELVDGRFVRPARALDEWRAGELAIAPPVVFLLECLAAGPFETFFERADRQALALEAGRPHPMQFSPGVRCLPLRTPTVPPATTTNCHAIGEDDVWIVDPATYAADERERLFEFLDDVRARGRRLRGVLVTHHHPDHIGSVHAVAERYGLCVWAHGLTLARIAPPACGARELCDGDRLELGAAPDGSPDWHLRAMHTPGHDRGHMAFVESRYRAAILGDLVSTLSTIVIDPPEGHLATYLASLRRVLAERIGVVHPAHGPAVRDGPALLRHYVEHRAAREAKLRSALADGAVTEDELLAVVYDDVDLRVLGLARRSLLAGLEKLADEGRALRDGKWWRASS